MATIRMQLGLMLVVGLGLAVSGCSQGFNGINKTTTGAVTGGALGAGTGAIIGSATGRAGAGVAIGAALGTVGGALLGNQLDQQDEANRQLEGQLSRNQEALDENRRLIEELRKRGADVRSSRRGVVINLPDILFEFDRANLTPEAVRTVGEISDVLRGVEGRRIAVEGHTDSVGTVVYNKQLSTRRAEGVARELSRNGVSRGNMQVEGFGEGSPISTNNSDAGRARNRRVEVIIENRR